MLTVGTFPLTAAGNTTIVHALLANTWTQTHTNAHVRTHLPTRILLSFSLPTRDPGQVLSTSSCFPDHPGLPVSPQHLHLDDALSGWLFFHEGSACVTKRRIISPLHAENGPCPSLDLPGSSAQCSSVQGSSPRHLLSTYYVLGTIRITLYILTHLVLTMTLYPNSKLGLLLSLSQMKKLRHLAGKGSRTILVLSKS